MSFGSGSCGSYGDSDECFHQPNTKPSTRRSLASRGKSGGDGSNAHGHATPARDGGKFAGTLHGFADVAEMVGGAGVDGNGFAFGRAEGADGSHGQEGSRKGRGCQVLCITKLTSYFARGYRPVRAFQRMMKTSKNICTLSRSMLTLVAGE